jgi:hypothetical protein
VALVSEVFAMPNLSVPDQSKLFTAGTAWRLRLRARLLDARRYGQRINREENPCRKLH